MKFIDYHSHIYGTGYKVLYPRLDGLSINDIRDVVIEAIRNESIVGDGYLLLRGWDQNVWEDNRYPSRELLDDITGDLPTALIRIDGHSLWCNSSMLNFAGITSQTTVPSGGEIIRSSTGEPTGVLIDEAMGLVYQRLPSESNERIASIIRAGLNEFGKHHSAVFDMGIPREWWKPLKDVYAENDNSIIESYVFLDMTKPSGRALFLERIQSGVFNDSEHSRLHLIGIKLYLDGALGSRGAHLFDDYTDDPGNRGLRLMDDNEALMLMGLAADRDLQIAVHAIGDAANSRALDLFSLIRKRYPKTKSVLRIEHSQIVRERDIERYRDLDVWAIIQPQFWTSDHEWAVNRLGQERMRDAYRWRSLVEAGVKTAASSDSPVEEADPNLGIAALTSDRNESLSYDQGVDLYMPKNELLHVRS